MFLAIKLYKADKCFITYTPVFMNRSCMVWSGSIRLWTWFMFI